MSDTIDYIDDYFTGALNDGERKEFEARCVNDESFASEVAFYVSARQSVRDILLQQKQEKWGDQQAGSRMTVVKSSGKSQVIRFISYAAAACVVFVIGTYLLFYKPTPQRLADKYIDNVSLSQLMDASHDSLQAGIATLKAGDYEKALMVFEELRNRDAGNDEAKKYAGYTYLQLHNYDKALERFRELSAMNGLQSNSGDIFQAVTLLKRNAPGDDRAAKALLEKIVQEDEEGSKEAKGMLDAW